MANRRAFLYRLDPTSLVNLQVSVAAQSAGATAAQPTESDLIELAGHGLDEPLLAHALPVPITALRLSEILSLQIAKLAAVSEDEAADPAATAASAPAAASSSDDPRPHPPLPATLHVHAPLPVAQVIATPFQSAAGADADADSDGGGGATPGAAAGPSKRRGFLSRCWRGTRKFLKRHGGVIAQVCVAAIAVAGLAALVALTGPFGGFILVLGGLALGTAVGGALDAARARDAAAAAADGT